MALRFQQKLIIPSTARPLVERPRLLAELELAITTRWVVALAAPAGWGKTTALSQWAAGSRLPVAWYTLDPADRDPQLFLDYLLHAVAAYVPGAETIAAQLMATEPSGLPELYRAAALEIAAAPAPFVLVFDDFYTIEGPPEESELGTTARVTPVNKHNSAMLPGTAMVFDLLASIAEYAANCHLVIASRTVPTLRGIVRMATQQRATILEYTALQFSAADVQQLAGVAYARTLSDDSARNLAAQFSGWVTGVILALDQVVAADPSCRSADGVDLQTIDAVEAAQIYAYFAEQVIAPLAPELQRVVV